MYLVRKADLLHKYGFFVLTVKLKTKGRMSREKQECYALKDTNMDFAIYVARKP